MELMDLNGSAVADPNAFAFVGEQPDQADRLGGPGQT